jgi:histidinol-phosphate aminotransferase
MSNSLSRRAWFKSMGGLSAGLVTTSLMVDQLMAAPMSKAEGEFFDMPKANGKKVRLNSNENPYGPSEKAKQAMIQSFTECNRYGFGELEELKKAIAKKINVDPSYILMGAGSAELLVQAGIAVGLEGGRVLSAYPTFGLLMEYAEQMKAKWDKVDLNSKLEHDYAAMLSAIKNDTRLVFSCNPNNPTGTVVNFDTVKSFSDEASKKTIVYADEAYLEFLEPSQQKSMMPYVEKNPNLIVSRTFSKAYGLAGLRIGYIVCHPDLGKKIGQFGDTISPSQTALAAATTMLSDDEFVKSCREKNNASRKVLTDYLDKKKFQYGDSKTNVVFFLAPKDGKAILSKLDEKGFLIRVWEYQQKEWCRVSIGTKEEMTGFVKAFDEVIA